MTEMKTTDIQLVQYNVLSHHCLQGIMSDLLLLLRIHYICGLVEWRQPGVQFIYISMSSSMLMDPSVCKMNEFTKQASLRMYVS